MYELLLSPSTPRFIGGIADFLEGKGNPNLHQDETWRVPDSKEEACWIRDLEETNIILQTYF